MDAALLEILACPKCKGSVRHDAGLKGIVCEACRLVYPIQDDIPVMLVDEARPLVGGDAGLSAPKGTALFRVIEGKNKGEGFQLEMGGCKAIGRPLEDAGKTQVFNLDLHISLDDHSKRLITDFVTKQFKQKGGKGEGEAPLRAGQAQGGQGSGEVGAFRRTADVILTDTAVSRLHAMLFYDNAGVGILDLVSKNGTFVNGEEVESRLLKDGDMIEVGGTKIRLELK